MSAKPEPGLTDGPALDGKLLRIGAVYFALFLAHSIWRITLHNNAVSNFDLSASEIGYVFSATYVPGIFAFSIGLLARRLPLYELLLFACLALAGGMLVVSLTAQLSVLILATLLIAFGFTFFYTVANSACLLGSGRSQAAHQLARLKSLGPLAGFAAAVIVVIVFAPSSLAQWLSLLDLDAPLRSLGELVMRAHSAPEVDASLLRSLLASLAVLLLLAGSYVGASIRLSHVGRSRGRFRIRRSLLPYYTLNFLAGCRSAIFQAFALFTMVKHYQLPVSGTALLVMVGHMCSFLGYRWVGLMLRRLRHAQVLALIYGVVACNFAGFWLLTSDPFAANQATVLGLGALFLIDSFFFGASVVTDSHLTLTGEPRDFTGDISAGMTLFSVAAWLMSMLGSLLWEPLGNKAFLLGSLVCLLAMAIGLATLNTRRLPAPADDAT